MNLDPEVFGYSDDIETADVVLVYLDSEARWHQLSSMGMKAEVTVVGLLPLLDPSDFRRALTSGAAGVVHADQPPDMILRTTTSAVGGETILPTEAARMLAAAPIASARRAP